MQALLVDVALALGALVLFVIGVVGPPLLGAWLHERERKGEER